MDDALRAAVARDELRLAYQPEVALVDGTLVGFEATIWWAEPGRGSMGPAALQAAAHGAGLGDVVTARVVRRALSQLAAWQGRTGRPLRVSVNVPAAVLCGVTFVDRVVAMHRASGVEPGTFVIGIDAPDALDARAAPALRVAVNALRRHGARIALSRFGAGYPTAPVTAGGATLGAGPVDLVRVDRGVVGGVSAGAAASAYVKPVIAAARAMGAAVSATGVESEHQRVALLDAGCSTAQGLLWAPPMGWSECEDFIFRRRVPSPRSRSEHQRPADLDSAGRG